MQQGYRCPRCNAKVTYGVRFCGNCGMQLNWPTQQQTQHPPNYQKPQQSSQWDNYKRQAYNPKDRIYIAPITVDNDPYGDTNVLFCDGEGNLSTSHVDEAVINFIHDLLDGYRAQNKYCTVVCLDLGGGKSVTFGFEIEYEDALALGYILAAFRDHKIVNRMIPETYRKHVRRVIGRAYAELPGRLEHGGYINL
jgi:hypothetical protein